MKPEDYGSSRKLEAGKHPGERMNISINMIQSGKRIKQLISESGYSIHEIMRIVGITAEQTVYKWYRGQSLPSLEALVILCKLLDLNMSELLVLEGDVDFPERKEQRLYSDGSRQEHLMRTHEKQEGIKKCLR